MPTLITDINATDWSPKLGEIGAVVEELDDISQCIRIILTTPKGSDPHRPLFGSDIHLYIDYPIPEAIPHVIREAIDAITIWEPRIKLVKVAPVTDGAQLTLQIEWKLNEDNAVQRTNVTVYGAA
ncbi:MAG: baseplate protein [Chlorobiaceae bacterium]|nr:baseplate protein [Chlorobiaceae bacterium]